ncbi:EscU/YscU/HrcU family type III secretion system export apparatus switch protein [Clostridium sp. ATCC 25772]|uniref:Flagellar biogenesis protein n=1 Tax=Clostridium senegalense TaxID=1465809 RepID=A0A6M0GYV9_9CLOT|nr:EscU/YscU/HrcU family type III secretion system export apparatus switch protein [Clostridium sp. ATCC 25772]NEU03756.1 flagellar biogenesis protein [Clostridium senegalense]
MKNKKKAAALKYDLGSSAPKVTAVGMGHIADKIIEHAKEAEVPIVENKELTNLLTNVNVGDEIPAELYDVVAKVIAYVMDVDNRMKK